MFTERETRRTNEWEKRMTEPLSTQRREYPNFIVSAPKGERIPIEPKRFFFVFFLLRNMEMCFMKFTRIVCSPSASFCLLSFIWHLQCLVWPRSVHTCCHLTMQMTKRIERMHFDFNDSERNDHTAHSWDVEWIFSLGQSVCDVCVKHSSFYRSLNPDLSKKSFVEMAIVCERIKWNNNQMEMATDWWWTVERWTTMTTNYPVVHLRFLLSAHSNRRCRWIIACIVRCETILIGQWNRVTWFN